MQKWEPELGQWETLPPKVRGEWLKRSSVISNLGAQAHTLDLKHLLSDYQVAIYGFLENLPQEIQKEQILVDAPPSPKLPQL